jgi:hypothetical protein
MGWVDQAEANRSRATLGIGDLITVAAEAKLFGQLDVLEPAVEPEMLERLRANQAAGEPARPGGLNNSSLGWVSTSTQSGCLISLRKSR